MTITTKYEAGDSIWLIDDNDIINTVIVGIEIRVDNVGEYTIHYQFGHKATTQTRPENKVFKDKNDLIDYINKIRG